MAGRRYYPAEVKRGERVEPHHDRPKADEARHNPSPSSDVDSSEATPPQAIWMCDFHKTGTCMAGDLCRFAHEANELTTAATAWVETSGIREPGAMQSVRNTEDSAEDLKHNLL
eukprot:g31057.t1